MGKLTTADRKKLPATDFAGPKRSYPVEDAAHAKNAKARAAQQVAKGKLSPASEKRIDAKADRVLGNADKPAAKPAKSDARGGYREPHGRDSRGHGGHSGSLRHLGEAGRDGSVAAAEHHGYKHTSEDR